MCARYTLTLEQARLVIAGLVHIFAFAPRYNIGPAQRVPVILDTAEGVKAVEMRWGNPDPLPRANSIARWRPAAAGNPPAAALVARCVADSPAIPFPNHPATAR
jgi:putative SOS response-associated peptidase YedK